MFYAVLVLVGIAAAIVAAVSGFGIGSLLTPTMAAIVPAKLAVAAVSIPHVIATAHRFWLIRDHLDLKVLKSFGLMSALGGLVGAAANSFRGFGEQPPLSRRGDPRRSRQAGIRKPVHLRDRRQRDRSSRSYSACVPIQIQTQPSSSRWARARWRRPTRADQSPSISLNRSDLCEGSDFNCANARSAAFRISSGSAW